METLKGIAVSPGIVIGRVFVLDDQHRRIPKRTVRPEQLPHEHNRLWVALGQSITELNALRDRTRAQLGEEAGKIFGVHIGMLSDASLTKPMHELMEKERVTAEYAVWKGFEDLVQVFQQLPDPTFQTKVDDLRDLSSRVIRHLIGEHAGRLKELNTHAVVVARDLTPSQAAGFDRRHVMAFATDLGGKTSHTAIVARALGIPAVVGIGHLAEKVTDDTPVIIDGDWGMVVIEPDEATLADYEDLIEARKVAQLSLEEVAKLPSVTADGTPICLLGNIEFPEEIENVIKMGGEGVGLYRTEFLYLTGQKDGGKAAEPTEEDHFAAYKKAVELSAGRPLTIRTMDLGADKYTQAQMEEAERNPFLGLRSIRYCLQNLPMFKAQLRAILRASAFGPIKIMFPLVTNIQELRQGRYLINDVMEDLDEEGIPFDRNIPIGIMVEVPATAVMADLFARESAFFSIGTNDLVQYILAVDRTNERVANLYNPFHPAVIATLKDIARSGKRHAIPVSCCGESAGEPDFALLLIGLGLRTLSATASSLPNLKRMVRKVTIQTCERIARKAASLDSDAAVMAFVRDQARKIIPEAFDGRSAER
ncbi:MAG TPA: phosphoenolpyruvate--protein phosphotransferase [Phycisphaerales bacterium]|jgi:phosphotransferase system enzyme I (PtsI)|nr:phosphoenolpyruvate--protein phosphotransferase [Phycisphaerales bacterium]